MTQISYHYVREFPAWLKAPEFLRSLIADYKPRVLLEIGSGANPTLDAKTPREGQLRYITSDASQAELAKAPPGFEARVLNLESEARHLPPDLLGCCDMVFSRMVNEHVSDGRTYHQNILLLLAPGGIAVHCFSTLYAFPFVVNGLLSNRLSQRLCDLALGRDNHTKFPAHYSWSRGPTALMLKRFADVGYDVICYRGYFGHSYYSRFKVLDHLESWKARALLAFPNPLLCSYAVVILQRPVTRNRHRVNPVQILVQEPVKSSRQSQTTKSHQLKSAFQRAEG